jgi:hypothetical protein
VDFNAEATEFAEKEGTPHPRVFFVRVADKGLMVDAASSTSRKEKRLRIDPSTTLRARSLKLKGEKREEAKTNPSLRSLRLVSAQAG